MNCYLLQYQCVMQCKLEVRVGSASVTLSWCSTRLWATVTALHQVGHVLVCHLVVYKTMLPIDKRG